MKDFDHILLFKTNCATSADKEALHGLLDKQPGIERWNVDQEDTDCVLRVVSHTLNHKYIIQLINNHGYNCCELT